jgi:hypothetical protein
MALFPSMCIKIRTGFEMHAPKFMEFRVAVAMNCPVLKGFMHLSYAVSQEWASNLFPFSIQWLLERNTVPNYSMCLEQNDTFRHYEKMRRLSSPWSHGNFLLPTVLRVPEDRGCTHSTEGNFIPRAQPASCIVFQKKFCNVTPNDTLRRVLRKRLHLKAYKLSFVQGVFVALATKYHLECHCKALFETSCNTVGSHIQQKLSQIKLGVFWHILTVQNTVYVLWINLYKLWKL